MGLPLSWAAGEALERCLMIKYQIVRRRAAGVRVAKNYGVAQQCHQDLLLPLSFCPSTLTLLLSFEAAVAILASLLYPG